MPEVLTRAIESALHFGPFRLLRSQKLLLEGDKPLRLGSRAFDILTVLAERAGAIVSKDELIAHAWPDTVVEENSLRVHIAALRRTLGDGQEGLRYIANVPGRGYCFVAPVFRPSEQVANESTSAADRPIHNLPVRLTRMIGRSQVVESLAAALPRYRFVSVVGPGGMGKTTLALAVAEDTLAGYAHGARFVDLALLANPQLVPSALAAALDVSVATEDPVSGLVTHLRDKRLLIVLDNCEHVIEAAAALAVHVLKAAPGIHILATSREPLRAEGERVVRLASLAAPPESTHLSAAAALSFPAVQLFVERAVATLDSFELTDADAPLAGELCRRLDGLPLAIELAAARVGFFGIRELVARLDDRFRLLTSGRRTVLARHQTLRALLDWSYELLSDSERVTLRRLAVFKGSFTLESAGAVAADNGAFGCPDVLGDLTALAAKSLVTVDVNEEVTRYRLLDTTRTYALEKLVRSDEGPKICRRHAEHLCDLLVATDVDAPATVRAQWLATYGRLIDEVRAALDWAFSLAGDVALGVRLTEASTSLAHQLSLLDEYRARVERALSEMAFLDTPQPSVELRLNVVLGAFAGQTRGAHDVAARAFRRAFELAEQTGQTQHKIESLFGLWVGAFTSADYAESLRLADAMAAAAKADADAVAMVVTDRMMAQSQHCLGNHAVAREFVGRVLDRPLEQLQFVKSKLPSVDRRVSMRIILARILWIEGCPEQATHMASEAFELALSDVAFGVCHALAWSACPVALWTGDRVAARRLTQTLLEQSTKYALEYWQSWARNYERVLLQQAPIVSPTDPKQSDMFGTFVAARVGAKSIERVESGRVGWCAPEMLRAHGENLKARGAAVGEVEALFQRSLELSRRQGALSWELRTATSLGRLWQEQGRAVQACELLGSVRARFTEGFATADLQAADALLVQWAPTYPLSSSSRPSI